MSTSAISFLSSFLILNLISGCTYNDISHRETSKPIPMDSECEGLIIRYHEQLGDVLTRRNLDSCAEVLLKQYAKESPHRPKEEVDLAVVASELQCTLITAAWEFIVRGYFNTFVAGLNGEEKREQVRGVIIAEYLRFLLEQIERYPADFIAANMSIRVAQEDRINKAILTRLQGVLRPDELASLQNVQP
jgi:hypothetical protein